MSAATRLYSPDVLALATSLAALPLDDGLTARGFARSAACGSTIELGLALDGDGRIARIGMKPHACAIGQASAALFAAAACGKNGADIAAALAGLEQWLGDPQAALPTWPGLEAIAAARDFPARHGAILLAWKAALDALP